MKNKTISVVTLFSVLMLNLMFCQPVYAVAGTITAVSDTMSRVQKTTLSSHTIKFTTSVAVSAAADTIAITFPSGYSFATKAISSVSFTHGASTGSEATEVLAATPDATKWGAVFSGTGNVIFTLTAPTDGSGAAILAANDKVIIAYDATNSTNPSTAASYNTTIAIAGANTASSSFETVILDSDQIAVSATVDPTLSFSVTNTTLGFGHFAGTALRYATSDTVGSPTVPSNGAPAYFTVSTNALTGATIAVSDAGSGTNPGLWSSANSELIPAAASTAVTTGSKKYGVYAKNASNLTIAEGFDHDSTSDLAISRTAQTLATAAGPVSAATVDIALISAIDGSTKAGTYADILTVVCTGNF